MKRFLLFTTLVVLTAACAADSDGPTAVESTTSAVTESTTSVTGNPEIPTDAPDAPDFVFTLGDGTEYHLGSDNKPVYLIFWAQW